MSNTVNTIHAILFDLDDTLISTSKLEPYRRSNDRSGLIDNIHKAKIYAPVLNLLAAIRNENIPVGIVTNAPKWYADIMISHFSLGVFDTLITYDDVGQSGIKPSPKGINLAIENLALSNSNNIIYIGDQGSDFNAAYLANIRPIAPSWAQRKPLDQIPAAILNSQSIINSFANFNELELISDRTGRFKNFNFEKSQLSFLPIDRDGNPSPLNANEIEILALGRYFSQKSVLTSGLHESHPLSKDIARKDKDEKYVLPRCYIDLLTRSITQLEIYISEKTQTKFKFDIITVVPSKPKKNPRLENALANIQQCIGISNRSFIKDLFQFHENSPSLKTIIGGKPERIKALEFHLHLNERYKERLSGKNILIIDDVLTTGSTIERCFNLLDANLVSKHYAICLAKTVSYKDNNLLCPQCSRPLAIRKNQQKGTRFYGCTGYFEKINQCKFQTNLVIKPCPQCDGDLVERKGSKSIFLGCTNFYNGCTYSEAIPTL